MVMTTRIRDSMVNTIRARSNASSLLLSVKYSVKTGMNAMVSDPSAKRRRNRFGIRRATKKASAAIPDPKIVAMTISRTSPRIRLRSVKKAMTPAAPLMFFLSGLYNVFKRAKKP